MREVIQKVLAAEAEAKRAVQAARSEAECLLVEARKKGQEIREQTRLKTEAEAGKLIAVAAQEAEQKKQAAVARSAAEIERQIYLDEAAVRAVTDAVVRRVSGFS